MKNSDGSAWVNGELSDLAHAKIPATDRGFLFGHSVFETLLVLNGKIILWQDHMARLATGCKKALISMPQPQLLLEAASQVIAHHIERSKHTAAKMQLRLIVSGGSGLDMALPQKNNSSSEKTAELLPNVVLFCRDARLPSGDKYEKGMALKTYRDVRPRELIDVKSCNYLWSIMALEAARAEGFDDALFVNSNNELTESTTANFIWFDNQHRVCSVPLANNCLPGTTFLCLQRALQEAGQNVLEKSLNSGDLKEAQGGAILSSVRGLVPVERIDELKFNTALLTPKFAELNRILLIEQEKSAYTIQSL